MHIYAHTHIYTHTCTHIYAHIHIYAHTHAHTYMHTHIRINIAPYFRLSDLTIEKERLQKEFQDYRQMHNSYVTANTIKSLYGFSLFTLFKVCTACSHYSKLCTASSHYSKCVQLVHTIKSLSAYTYIYILHFSVFGQRNCAYKAIGRPYIYFKLMFHTK